MPHKSWSEAQKNIIASQVNYIRHWRISHTSYENIPNENATWFIDPPYQKAGKTYKESSKNIDFNHLSEWCKERQGEVIVCENLGADWLPFKEFQNLRSTIGKATTEAMYIQGFNEIQLSLFGDEQK
jgi:16S rRNA G966 N2-methylase RsmD